MFKNTNSNFKSFLKRQSSLENQNIYIGDKT